MGDPTRPHSQTPEAFLFQRMAANAVEMEHGRVRREAGPDRRYRIAFANRRPW